MSRAKKPITEYNNKGLVVQKYDAMIDVFKKHYEGKKRPLYLKGELFGILPNGNYISADMYGRDIASRQRVRNSEYVRQTHKRDKDDRKIGMYNLLDEEIAVFKNILMASVITKLRYSLIHHSISNNLGHKYGDVYFRYLN